MCSRFMRPTANKRKTLKPKYQIYLIEADTGRLTLEGWWGSEHARFDNLADAEEAVAELQIAWPGTEWEIRGLPETYWSADLKQWITGSLTAPM